MGTRTRRVAKELADVHNDTASNIQLDYDPDHGSDSLEYLEGVFKGPPDTPYEGGTYKIAIHVDEGYPFKPPKMKFKTKVYHPNISSQTGAICLDTLSTAWSPVLTLKSALLSLQSLLSSPEAKDPQDAEVASMLIKDPDQFGEIAREWAEKHAGAPSKKKGQSSGGGAANARAREREKTNAEEEQATRMAAYGGYNQDLINRFVMMGFDLDRVVSAFDYVGIERNGGEDYELEEAYMGDITANLLGEP